MTDKEKLAMTMILTILFGTPILICTVLVFWAAWEGFVEFLHFVLGDNQ